MGNYKFRDHGRERQRKDFKAESHNDISNAINMHVYTGYTEYKYLPLYIPHIYQIYII